MALISDNNFKIACHGNKKQLNCYSQTSLLSNRIKFKSSRELTPDDSDEEDILSIKKFHNKYNVLVPETGSKGGKGGNFGNRLSNEKQQQANKDIDNELGDPKHVLFPPNKVLLEWKKISKIGSGLSNLGNTCFMNSVLQSLTYCPPLVNYLFSNINDHSAKCHLNFCMICLLHHHVDATLNRKMGNVFRPNNIAHRLKSIARHFTFGRQEDAHEFLRYVIDHMWRACLTVHEKEMGIANTSSKFDHLTKATTAINQIFGGYHRSQISCFNCKAKSNTYDYFMDFMLDIHNVSSLEDALRKFVTPEILRNDNSYKCSNCKKSVTAKKQFTVYRAPNVATFQFKRFDCTRMLNSKITKLITYPERLNLRPYMSESTGPPIMYKLISVLIHLGASTSSGHYFCYVRNSNNSWYLMDDAHVSQANASNVLNQKAYVLFYIKQSPESNTLPVSRPLSQPSSQSVPTPPNHNHNRPAVEKNSTPSSSIEQQRKLVTPPPSTPVTTTTTTTTVSAEISKTAKVIFNGNASKVETHKISTVKEVTVTKEVAVKKEEVQTTKKVFSIVPKVAEPSRPTLPPKHQKPIPVIKVKAVTNSWQVVENKSVDEDDDDDLEAKPVFNNPKEWRISEASTSSTEECKSSLPLAYADDDEDDGENQKGRKLKKSKKRKHKSKDKEQKKKKKKQKTSDMVDDESGELSWVERTKETLEMEKKGKPDEGLQLNIKLKSQITQEATKKAGILDALLKGASHGYGENVKKWDGGVSKLNGKGGSNGHHNAANIDDDDYNEEFDRGKVKKVKHNLQAAPQRKFNSFDKHMKDYHKHHNSSNNNGRHHHHNRFFSSKK